MIGSTLLTARTVRRGAAIAAVSLLCVSPVLTAEDHAVGRGGPHRGDWPMIGHDPANTRNQPLERTIGPENVGDLALKWAATVTGDISATPAVVAGAVYVGDFGGTVWKLDADTGAVIWSHLVSDYTGIAGDIARTSPSLHGQTLIVGDLKAPYLLGIDARTGTLRWKTQVHPDPRGIMTGSPVLVGDTVITGVSASGASGPGATFRGAIVAVNAETGNIRWRSYSVPDNGGVAGGYSGATMFSPPAVSEKAGLVYGTFGQTYTMPADVAACHAAHGGFGADCDQPGAYYKSIVAFDLATGEARWSYRVWGHAHWAAACGSLPAAVTWCPAENDSEKWDLGGSGVNVMRVKMPDDSNHGRKPHERWRDVVGIGEKSGVYTLLDAVTGEWIWSTLVGPGGDQGGVEWGTAFDGQRIYVPITNHHHLPYKLTENGVLGDSEVTGGSWAALDPVTGRILWQVADPQVETLQGVAGTVGVWDLAPVSVANGVLYAGSMAKMANQNQMFALDAATGTILWQFGAGSSVNAAPAIVDGVVYWGSGYSRSGVEGSGNTTLFAFSLGSRR